MTSEKYSFSKGKSAKFTDDKNNPNGILEYALYWTRAKFLTDRFVTRFYRTKSINKMLLLYGTTFVILSLCACPVTSLRACGGELTNLLMEHCGEMKRVDDPPMKRMDPESSYSLSTDSNESSEHFQMALIAKVQELLNAWRQRHAYDVSVGGLRVRRRRRAVTLSGFLDQCCHSGCRLSDLVSVGFC